MVVSSLTSTQKLTLASQLYISQLKTQKNFITKVICNPIIN